MTDKELAQVCADLYQNATPLEVAGISYSITETDTDWVLCPRGSKSPQEWMQDFMALPVWTRLGMIHSGAWMGVEALYAIVKPLAQAALAAGKKITITGHSLGGGHAHLFGGLFTLDGIKVTVVTFAGPRFGWANLRRVYEKAGVTCRNYQYNNDPVPCVAPLPYEQAMPLTHLVGVTTGDSLDPLRDHHIGNYINALPQDSTS
jgi:hypothetical protein